MLKEETIKELKKILKEDYGQDLSLKEATEAADILVRFFDLLAETYYQNTIQENHKTKRSSVNNQKI